MATQSLAKKLQLKAGQRLLAFTAPRGYADILAADQVEVITERSGQIDAVHIFAEFSRDVIAMMAKAQPTLKAGARLWISYPKKGSGIKTDLTRDRGWEPLTIMGWRPVRQISVDKVWSALRFVQEDPLTTDEDLLDAQYAGTKAHLRPIYDRLEQIGYNLGSDVSLAVRKSYVALVRQQQFAVIKPSTRTRVDLGLKFAKPPNDARLVEAPNLGSGSITHKVALTSLDEIDDQIVAWMRLAYEGVSA